MLRPIPARFQPRTFGLSRPGKHSTNLSENILHLVEDRRIPLSRLVLHLQRRSQLLNQLTLFARQLGWRQHAHVIIQITLAAAARISQALALQPEHRAALRAFGNLQLLFADQTWHLHFRAQRRLRDADRNRAIQIGAAPLKERVLLHFQHDIQIPGRTAVRSWLALAADAQPRSGIDSGRNSQLDRFFALDAPLTAAIRAALLDHLSRALASWARSRDREKSLLIRQLAAPAARRARCDAGSFFRAGAIARLAVFLPRQLHLGVDAGRRFFERERHVIAKIRATLRSSSASPPATAAKHVLEAEEIPENIVAVLKDRPVEIDSRRLPRQSCVSVIVVNLALLRIAQHAVRFGALAKLDFCFRFVFRVAIGVILQRALAVRRFDLFDARRARHAEYFVIVPLIRLRHSTSLSWCPSQFSTV